MFKKHSAHALITILSFIISIGGIINNIFYTIHLDNKAYLNNQAYVAHLYNEIVIKQLLDPLNLDWVFSYGVRNNGHNYVNGVFYILLLLGAIVYITSKNTKSILIRFVFSIIFFSNILSFVHSLLYYLSHLSARPFSSIRLKDILLDIVFYISYSVWIYVSYQMLKYFDRNKALSVEVVEENGKTNSYYVKAFTGKRFLHPLVDVFVAIALFSPILELFVHFNTDNLSRLMWQMHETWAEKNIWLLILIVRILYYLFFETVLGATPAKFLTETRVIDYDGTKPSFKNILVRTLSRLVPFEAFSFFADDGWHDKWSRTLVVKEETGIK
jgi:uncharacterized RDD family membrane protein YckC